MSAPGTRAIIWDNGEDVFCLSKVGLLFDLEEKCKAPFAVVLHRLEHGMWGINDIRETIRLGLIGGGMEPKDALAAVKRHVDENEHGLAPSALVALAILQAVMFGVPDDPVGKDKPAGAQETGSSTRTDASDAPKSSPSARASAGRRG
jgi:hypothetical protein